MCFNDTVLKHMGQLLPLPVAGILEQGLDIKDRELKFGSTYFIKTDDGGFKCQVSTVTRTLFNLHDNCRAVLASLDEKDVYVTGQCCPVHLLKVHLS
jgi:hypothetical protein